MSDDVITIAIRPTSHGWEVFAERVDTGECRVLTADRIVGRHENGTPAVIVAGDRPSLEAALRAIGRNLDAGRI